MENFDAKGQIVFIEPRWVTGETCLFNINNKIDYAYAKGKVTKIRKEFIQKLEDEGFIITYDKNYNEDEVVSFIMNDQSVCDDNKDTAYFKKEFDKIIFNSGGKNFYFPKTVRMEEFLKNPFYPVVMKNEIMNAGIDKFLIETQEQLEIIKKFYNDFKDKDTYKEVFDCTIFQELIETPTNFKTYMRVLMSASGDVMGASLKYSEIGIQRREASGLYEKYFWNPKSEYYLNCSGMFNYYSGGGEIYFNQPRYGDRTKKILTAHGIDPLNPKIPSQILEVAGNIAQKCNKQLGIMCGIDFIYNEKDNNWYYLEVQAFPAVDEWLVQNGHKKMKVGNVDNYIKCLAIETEVRHEALKLYVNKKEKNQETPKKYELKS